MTAVDIEVDTRSPTPHYEQIRSQVTRLVLSGALPAGTRLPPIRQLAGHLGLSNGVVARAYRELEGQGTVTTGGKKGTTVAHHERGARPALADRDRAGALAAAASTYAIHAHHLGYDLPEAIGALEIAMTSPLQEPLP